MTKSSPKPARGAEMTAEFTPGPWHLWCNGRDGAFEITAALPDGVSGGMVVVQRGGMSSWLKMATANAHLIATAPELYGALAQARQVLATYQPDSAPTFYMEAIWNAETALAKARGESVSA